MNYRIFILLFFCSAFAGCSRDAYIMAPKASVEKATADRQMPDSLTTKFNNGIDYYISGNDPVPWTLSMDYEGEFSFMSPGNNLNLIAKAGKVTKEGIEYLLEDISGKMKINILNAICADAKSNQSTVAVNQKMYSGCAQALYDKNLDGTWQLIKIKNKLITNKEYPSAIPKLKIVSSTNKISVINGCSQMESIYKVAGNKLTIPLQARNAAKCNNDFATVMDNNFYGNISSYYVRQNELFIYLNDDSILTFKRKEE